MKVYQKITALLLSILCVLLVPISVYASENSDEMLVSDDNSVIVLRVDDETDLLLELDIREPRSGEYVYANAHGWFVYTGTTTKISQYGFDVTFKVTDNTSSVSNGGYISAYHNSSVEEYTALYETSMSGEGTSDCSAKGTFTIVKKTLFGSTKNTGTITLKLSIDSDGKKTMHVSGNYDQWDVIWG